MRIVRPLAASVGVILVTGLGVLCIAPAAVKVDPKRTKTYAFDASSVRGDNGAVGRKIAAHVYEDGQSTLLFIAANHRNEETLRLVDAAFKGRAPWQVVIIERESYRAHPCDVEEKTSYGQPEPCRAMDLVVKPGQDPRPLSGPPFSAAAPPPSPPRRLRRG